MWAVSLLLLLQSLLRDVSFRILHFRVLLKNQLCQIPLNSPLSLIKIDIEHSTSLGKVYEFDFRRVLRCFRCPTLLT